MYKSTLAALALALAGAVAAQKNASVVQLFLVGFEDESLVGSIITSNSAATTYSVTCGSVTAECDLPTSFTFAQGPSTIHYAYNQPVDQEGDSESISFNCNIANSSSGACTATIFDIASSTSTISSITTITSFSNLSVLGAMPVTLTAGATPGVSSSVSSTSARNSSTSTSSTTTSSTAVASTITLTMTSSGGVPKITGNAHWVVRGAAALALAAW